MIRLDSTLCTDVAVDEWRVITRCIARKAVGKGRRQRAKCQVGFRFLSSPVEFLSSPVEFLSSPVEFLSSSVEFLSSSS